MRMGHEYLDLLKWAVNEALKLGADEAEVFFSHMRGYIVNIEAGDVKNPTFLDESGVGIRVIKDKKLGYASINVLERDSILAAIKRALAMARASKENPKWVSLPEAEKYPTISGVYDKRIEKATASTALDVAKRMVTSVFDTDKRAIPAWGGTIIGVEESVIVNSHGVEGVKKGTFCGANLGVIARDGTVTTPIHTEFSMSRGLYINPEDVGKNATKNAIQSLQVTKIETGNYPVIFSPNASFMLFLFTLIRALEADFVQMKRSPYAGKIGETVMDEKLTIIDDGTLPGGIGSDPFDDEGVPSQRKVLVDKGVLREFLYDNYTARIDNRKSTGNGIRYSWMATQPKYELTPTISPTNFIIEGGDSSFDEMISEMKNGVYVLEVQGAHSSNPETGEVSVVATPAWRIENGEIKGLIPGLMLSMNIYDALKRIDLVSHEQKVVYNTILPWIQISEIRLVSK